jgi:nucleotide-binding universal stress UspA family protein
MFSYDCENSLCISRRKQSDLLACELLNTRVEKIRNKVTSATEEAKAKRDQDESIVRQMLGGVSGGQYPRGEEEASMYSKILIPLDGSKTAENVLPFARCFARSLQIPVELLAVVDMAEMARNVSAAEGLFLDTLIEDEARRYGNYLEGVAKNFPIGSVQYAVGKGKAADVIIESAAGEKETLIAMATHGRSGLGRFLLGSVAEKVLRGASNPLLLIRGAEKTPPWDLPALKSIVVPLDGSELAESILPSVEELAKKLDLEVTLLGVYGVPYGASSAGEGFYNTTRIEPFIGRLRSKTFEYLEKKAAELKSKGLDKVTFVAKEGLAADEIISTARRTPDTLIAMCSHGRAGVTRWMLGSVTETVVRHSGDPVFVVRARS